MGTGELRRIHSRVAWMFLPVERSMTVSAPHLVAQRIFSTSSSMLDATALLPMLALIFTRKLRPMIIGSDSGWLMLSGMMAGPPTAPFQTWKLGEPVFLGAARILRMFARQIAVVLRLNLASIVFLHVPT